tara:strand:+ start:371 stop:526 length:156 start_codon:yes stop_codon:yes gene_type:complete
MFICLKGKRVLVDISMVVVCYASDVIEYDSRRSEVSDAALHMKQDTTSIEQ